MNSSSGTGESRLGSGSLPMLVVLYGAAFAAAFNENIINVALVSIMDDFSVSANTAQWLVTGYMVVTTIVITITAFLSRRMHLRTLFFSASILIVAGSIVCVFAPNFPVLLTFRLLQAIGTGLFIPTMMSTVLVLAPRKKLGTYLSVGGCMITFGPAFAPVISGLMVTMLGWRMIFVPAAAFVALLAIVGLFLIKNISEPERIKLDVVSVVLAAVGLFLFVYGLSIITSSVAVAVVLVILGIACIAVFAIRQFRIENPLLNLEPLRNTFFSPVCLLMIVAMMTSFSMSVLLPLYFEGSLGTTSLMAGVMLLAPILFNALTSVLGGRIMDRFGSWPLLPCGFGLIVIGQILICLLATQLSWAMVLGAAVVVYAGVGFIFSPTQAAGLQTLSPEENPHGVALINTSVQMSAAIGPSLFVGILSSVSAHESARGAAEALAQATGFSSAVFVAAIIAIVGFVIAFIYARVRHADRLRSKAVSAANEQTASELSVAAVMKEPYLVSCNASVREAMALLLDHKTSGLPVVDAQGNAVGFVSDGDILKALRKQDASVDLSAGLALYRDARSFDVRIADVLCANVMEIATTSIVSVGEDASIDEVCVLLSSRHIKKVPVLKGRRVIGTISRSDIVRAIMRAFVEENGIADNTSGDFTDAKNEITDNAFDG